MRYFWLLVMFTCLFLTVYLVNELLAPAIAGSQLEALLLLLFGMSIAGTIFGAYQAIKK